jgi:hypothetical protein
MERFGRWCEIAVGLFFLVGAAAKAYDIDAFSIIISSYGVIKDPALVESIAYGAVCIETVLGAMLLSATRLKGATHAATAGLTLVFSAVVFYAWRWNGLTDCGCLGTWIALDPPQTLAKNIVLLAALGAGWRGTRNLSAAEETEQTQWAAPVYMATAAVVAILALLTVSPGTSSGGNGGPDPTVTVDTDRPLSKFVFEVDGQDFDLGKGEYLVAMLSATCGHCQESVEGLNDIYLTVDLPDMVALVDGTEEEIDDFELFEEPLFPLHQQSLFDLMEFMSMPPVLIYARDGIVIETWTWKKDEHPPPAEDILEIVSNSRSGATDDQTGEE